MAIAPHDAALSFEALTAPLPDADPFGPDLESTDDAEYMNFMAAAEGLLPTAFYVTDPQNPERGSQPFDRTKKDFPAQFAKIAAFNARTRDLRLIVLLAKFRILDRDLSGFIAAIEALATLLDLNWDNVHPRGEEGDFISRMVALQSLDDMATVILPLIYAPLFEHKRFGSLSYRMHLLAVGDAAPRIGEDKPDPTLVKRAFEEDVDLDALIARRDGMRSLGLALARIKAAFVQHVGIVDAVDFPRLAELVQSIRALLDGYVVLRDPAAGDAAPAAAAEAEGEAAATASAGEIANFNEAAAALRAVVTYYSRFEPSNPALLLVRQAEHLIGKSFLDVIRVLVPGHVEKATLQIGRTHVFNLPIERLSGFAPVKDEAAPDDNIPQLYEVTTRDNALQLLAKVGAFYHRAEPSSPISFLIERARTLTGRDFLGLLKDMLPPNTLKLLEDGK